MESKRCEIGSMFVRRKMDVLALSETKIKGKEDIAFGEVIGRVSGVERGRAKEGVALLLSERLKNMVVEWKEVSSRLMWVRVRIGRECWAFISAYGPGCERSDEERLEFWNELSLCVEGLKRRSYVVVMGDLNARVGDGRVEGVLGKYGVPGGNESGERLLEVCLEQELAIGNSFFKKKSINKYTWVRIANGRVVERALMDYVLVTKDRIGRMKDVHVYRGEVAGMSDHFLVEAKVVVAKEWGNRVKGCRREEIKVEELQKPEKREVYQDRLDLAYSRVSGGDAGELEEEWGLIKNSLIGNAKDVCGTRFVGGGMRKGCEWWNEEVKKKVEEKKKAWEEWLQCNSEEMYERYKEKKVEAKRKVDEEKRLADFRRGQGFDRSYEENKKKFWKEVKNVRRGKSRLEEMVKDINGQMLRGNEVKGRWAEYFENLLNVEEDREAAIVAVGGVPVPVMGDENDRLITREEVERALNETKTGKAAGMDGVKAEMLKEGSVTVRLVCKSV